MKKETKKEIIERLSLYIDIDSLLSGTLQEVANNILNLEKRLREEHTLVKNEPNRFTHFKIELVSSKFEEGYHDIEISGVRLETDEEFKKRIEQNKKAKISAKKALLEKAQKLEEQQFATYKRLKEKFKDKE